MASAPRFLSLVTALSLAAGPSASAAEQCLVIGDSLTKEYEVEFKFLYPSNPLAWGARNWIEILREHRGDWFDLGSFGSHATPQIIGHSHNWGFPGATTQEIRDRLSSNSLADLLWQNEFEDQLENDVERVVVFAGGNDVDSYYPNLYNGQTASTFTHTTRDNLMWIVDWVRGINPNLPIVLVAVPHVGFAPQLQQGYPTDPVKTARVTTALAAINADLAAFAQSRGIGFAASVFDLTVEFIDQPFRIGGVEFFLQADADARARYVFSGDGFHPNTCAHAKVAQEVLKAFAATYPSPAIPFLSDGEILSNVLTVDSELAFIEWLQDQGVNSGLLGRLQDSDLDSLPQIVEFVFDELNPGLADATRLPQPVIEEKDGKTWLTLTWRPRDQALEWGAQIVPRHATVPGAWTDLPESEIIDNGDGSFTARIECTGGRGFLMLEVRKP